MVRCLPFHVAALVVVVSMLPLAAAQRDLAVKDGAKIAFLGDSITQGGARNAMGYCRLVIDGLKRSGIKAEMIPAGISGHKSNQMLARLQKDVIDKKPDWMTLSCGVNDVWHGARGVKLPEYKTNIRTIVERAQAAGIKVMILTSTMIRENPNGDLNKQLVPYNAFLRDLAKEKGCVLADLYERMRSEVTSVNGKKVGNRLTTDGVHMNPLGNMMMATGVLEAFGMSGDQLAASRKAWMEKAETCKIRVELKLSAADYEALMDLAAREGVALHELFQRTLDERKKSLLGR